MQKSIPIINNDGYVVLPHYLNEDYEEIKKIAKHCEDYLTLLRYFDLEGVVEFITFVLKNNYIGAKMKLNRHFESLDDINMKNIKIYYIKILQNIIQGTWGAIYLHFKIIRQPRILNNESVDVKGNKISKVKSIGPGITISKPTSLLEGAPLSRLASEQVTTTHNLQSSKGSSGVYVTTKDAYTLTDGPTIFISNDIEKIAKFCIQQANIPGAVMEEIMKKIEYNNKLNERIDMLEKELEFQKEKIEKSVKNNVDSGYNGGKITGRNKSSKDSKKLSRENPDELMNKGELAKISNEIQSLKSMIKSATLNETFVPNKKLHLDKWAEGLYTNDAFTSNVDDHYVSEIMALNGVDDLWKILLMMGIGVFINHDNITYTEIMKKMADEQKLYMIIASSDYIYGTNYQFCHSYISKDLDLTQEKIIQAMGRIGRNNIQQTYTVRFRDNQQILKLFTSETEKPEIINMNILFNSNKVIWSNNQYIELPEEDIENINSK